MNNDLIKKLKNEEGLTAVEAHELDRRLEEQTLAGIGHLMKKEEDPQPSLAWRSSLNEKLLAVKPAPKTPWLVRFWPVWAAPVAAGAAALAFMVHGAVSGPSAPNGAPDSRAYTSNASGTVEAALVALHRQGDAAEAAAVTLPDDADENFRWNEVESF